MDAILLISQQPAIIEKWQPVLALNYTVKVLAMPSTQNSNASTILVVDSQLIDKQLFALSLIKQSSAKCLIIGENWPEASQVNALLAGAAGYCEVAVPASVILKALESVSQNDIWVQRHLIHKVIGALVKPAQPKATAESSDSFACLSKREQDVAHLICQGVSNKRIAATLFISERTVKAHLTSIFNKLNVTNRLHLGLLLKKAEE